MSATIQGSTVDEHQPSWSPGVLGNEILDSPFRDCIGTFGSQKLQSFVRPSDGIVNGYVKFSWRKVKHAKQNSASYKASISNANGVVEIAYSNETSDEFASQCPTTPTYPSPAPSRSEKLPLEFSVDVSGFFSQPSELDAPSHSPAGLYPYPTHLNASTEVISIGAPKLLPPQYGYEAKMDDTDRRFWMFCT